MYHLEIYSLPWNKEYHHYLFPEADKIKDWNQRLSTTLIHLDRFQTMKPNFRKRKFESWSQLESPALLSPTAFKGFFSFTISLSCLWLWESVLLYGFMNRMYNSMSYSLVQNILLRCWFGVCDQVSGEIVGSKRSKQD